MPIAPCTHTKHNKAEDGLHDLRQGRLDAQRGAYLPCERTYLSAHLPMFRHLFGMHAEAIQGELETLCATCGSLTRSATQPLLLGRGAVYGFAVPDLTAPQAHLAATWRPWLGPQDQHPFRPHVTIQNKVDPRKARALYADFRVFA